MLVLHVSRSDAQGGASRAAYRIHRSIYTYGLKNGIESRMRVIEKESDDPTVQGGSAKIKNPFYRYLYPRLAIYNRYSIPFHTNNSVHHSFGWPDSGLGKELEADPCELVHLHWTGNFNGTDTLSIAEIGAIRKPLVWTLHDQWPFCGGEHYISPPPATDRRYIDGYSKSNRPEGEKGQDRNRKVWEAKMRHWKRPITIVCPSQWLASCARESLLMRGWPIHVIPHPIDLNVWAPCDQHQARALMELPQQRPLVLFGAMGAGTDPRKGSDLLLQALLLLRPEVAGTPLENLELVIFGQSQPTHPPHLGFPIHYTGRLHDDISLRLLYAAADVMVVPSRQEGFGQTATEAHACGTPVVAFRIGGPMDIVEDRVTGAMAEPFDPSSLSAAIRWVLENPERRAHLGSAARARAELLWDQSRVAAQYAEVYRGSIMNQAR